MGDIDERNAVEQLLRRLHPDRADAIIAASKTNPADYPCLLATRRPAIGKSSGKIVAVFDTTDSRECRRCGGSMLYHGKQCHAARMEQTVQRLNSAKLPSRYLHDMIESEGEESKLLTQLTRDSKGLWFYGPSGTGKSRRACMAARYCVTVLRQTARFVAFEELVRTVTASYKDGSEAKVYEDLERVDVLVLDEIPLGFAKRGSAMTEHRAKVLCEVVDARYRRGEGVLILTSNGDPAQVYAGIHRFDEWTAARLEDRLREMVCYKEMAGKSKRKGEKLTRSRPRTLAPSAVPDPLVRGGATWTEGGGGNV